MKKRKANAEEPVGDLFFSFLTLLRQKKACDIYLVLKSY